MTTRGITKEFPVPTAFSGRGVLPPDLMNLWFAEYYTHKIGRVTPSGTFTEYPTPNMFAYPIGIVTGPDGNLWFTEHGADKIGRITTAGSIIEYTIPTSSSAPTMIKEGSDGNLWFTESAGNKIGQLVF